MQGSNSFLWGGGLEDGYSGLNLNRVFYFLFKNHLRDWNTEIIFGDLGQWEYRCVLYCILYFSVDLNMLQIKRKSLS